MSDEFNYKQRPWTRRMTDEEYNRAVGKIPPKPTYHAHGRGLFADKDCPLCQREWAETR